MNRLLGSSFGSASISLSRQVNFLEISSKNLIVLLSAARVCFHGSMERLETAAFADPCTLCVVINLARMGIIQDINCSDCSKYSNPFQWKILVNKSPKTFELVSNADIHRALFVLLPVNVQNFLSVQSPFPCFQNS
jgi:hypothetical protein